MFKIFFIYTLTAIMGSSGCLPFVPAISSLAQENYYCDTTTYSNYAGLGTAESHIETITYDSMDYEFIYTDILIPPYGSCYGTNGCAPTAGSIAVTYYDYYYTNLIPNYEPTYVSDGVVTFKQQNTTIAAMQENLYNLMGTNTEAPGTSVAQFKTGMTSYFNTQGYNIGYNNVTNNINETYVKNLFNQEQIILLFLTSYDYYPDDGTDMGETEMSMLGYRKTAGHVVVAFAYVEFMFYNDNTLFRSDKYLYVAFGDSSRGYLPISNTSYIEEAYTLNIT